MKVLLMFDHTVRHGTDSIKVPDGKMVEEVASYNDVIKAWSRIKALYVNPQLRAYLTENGKPLSV